MTTLAEANRKYFDSIADTYDLKPWAAAVNQSIVDAVLSHLDWIGIPLANVGPDSKDREVRLLDYACGTGLWSRIFSSYVTETRGIDISPKMLSAYDRHAEQAGLFPRRVSSTIGDLTSKTESLSPRLSFPDYFNFDIVTVGFAFHHFEDVLHTARVLKDRLRPGGVLVLNEFLTGGDILADDEGKMIAGTEGDHAAHNHGHGHKHGHHHHHGHHSDDRQGHEHKHARQQDSAHDEHEAESRGKMRPPVAVVSFTVDGVKQFLSEAGYVDIDAFVLEKKMYIEFDGKKMFRTIFFARARKPFEEGKSEL
ncbi:S-adenosyl-L-methionine-dependent methyltransferase [Sporormia fimetaria CBS 119925]|uniref:S-adenosyl-L-methionine-dependent methyltransferase n=1 Tax=Sporormia fimetaria CBS 119925 TaxID=1340428 RepID=A0A6A6V6Z3_9PLEO|nr:S-adenosyl-L-methionine-dependent methyltransferase [Sporormia fimetaria CBS 119925]